MHTVLKVTQVSAILCLLSPNTMFAQNATSTPPPVRSLTDQVMEKARHLHEYLDLINNKDASVRLAAMKSALSDLDPTVRGVALASYLKRFEALTPEIVLDAASAVAQEDVPIVVINRVSWSADGTSFTGYSSGCAAYPVRGQIAGGKLAISFDGVCLRPSLLAKNANANPGNGRQFEPDSCQLTLLLNEHHDLLEGPLHCAGMSEMLKVALPFGA